MDAIDRIWRRLDAGWRLQTPPAEHDPAPGVTEQAIQAVEHLLDAALPKEVRASYRWHDGGYIIELVGEMDVLPLSEIAEWWQLLEELRHIEVWIGQPQQYFTEQVLRSGLQAGPIQPVMWHRRWIPCASDIDGNLACEDLEPAAGGAMGQIIYWDHLAGPSHVLFPSFERLLAALVEQVENRVDQHPE